MDLVPPAVAPLAEGRSLRAGALVGAVGIGWLGFAALAPSGAPLGVVFQGAVLGSTSALAALGIILVWRANKFINFAQGALGGAAGLASVMTFLEWGWPYGISLLLGVTLGAIIGALVNIVVVQRFNKASRLIMTVASLGLAQALGAIELLVPQKVFGVQTFVLGSYETPLSRYAMDMGPVRVSADYFLILGVVPVVVGLLTWFLQRSAAGIAIRASAENPDRARLLGVPVQRLHTLLWAIAGGLATLTFMLSAPISGSVSSAAQGPAVLMPALAAAVIAKMASLRIAVISAVLLGALDSLIRWNWGPELVDAVVLGVILAALLLQRQSQVGRVSESEDSWSDTGSLMTLPDGWRAIRGVQLLGWTAIAGACAAAISVPLVLGPSDTNTATIMVIWGMVAVSLVMLTGWGGQISLGQFGLVGFGAMIAGNLISRWDIDMFLSIGAAGLGVSIAAFLLGLPAMRIRGPFLAVVTLGFAATLDSYLLNPNVFPDWIPQTVERPVLFGRFPLAEERYMFWVCAATLALMILSARGLRRARGGRVLLAARDNRRAAEAMAVSSRRSNLSSFVISGAMAGIAGALHVVALSGAREGSYLPVMSIEVFANTTIGGLASIGGATAGAMGLRGLQDMVGQELKLLLNGVGLLVVLYVIPGGVAQFANGIHYRLVKRIAAMKGLANLAPEASHDRRGTGPDGSVVPDASAGQAAVPPGSDQRSNAARTHAHPSIVEIGDLSMSYGQLQVLFDVSIEIERGETLALLGTNGAGKSSLLKALCGLAPHDGKVRCESTDISNINPERLHEHGIALMSGGKSTFPTLTVEEHFRIATWTYRKDKERSAAKIDEAMGRFEAVRARRTQVGGNLSGGEQQQLALAQTLMSEPDILLIDELSLGLAPAIVSQLLGVVDDLHAQGKTIVVVEQSVNVALRMAERAVFMEKGAIRFSGPTGELLNRPDLLRAVFLEGAGERTSPDGSDEPVVVLSQFERQARTDDRAPVLCCQGVSKQFGGVTALAGVDLEVTPGKIVGLIGQNGAGKTTLMDCISGFNTIDAGSIMFRGREVSTWEPWERSLARLGRSFQEARLFPSLTVTETICVALERSVQSRSLAADALRQPASYESEVLTRRRADELVKLLGLTRYAFASIASLSTGTRRIVELACLLAGDPLLLLLDEPSAGVAQRETEALGPLLRRIRDETGAAMVIIEHDMALLSGLCDQLIAMELGKIIASGTPQTVLDDERVIESYLGSDQTAIARSGDAESDDPAGSSAAMGR